MAAFCVISKEATVWQVTCSKKKKKEKKEVIQKTFVEVSPRAAMHQDAATPRSSSLITQESQQCFFNYVVTYVFKAI